MKLIFLDIDGVLNSVTWARLYGFGDTPRIKDVRYKKDKAKYYAEKAKLNPSSVNLLNDLCKQTKAKVVISSTWRLTSGIFIGDRLEYWNEMFHYICQELSKKCHIDVIGITPFLDTERSLEIDKFIKDFKDEKIEEFVIIDDTDDGISDLFYHEFIHVSDDYGFGTPDFVECLRVLK